MHRIHRPGRMCNYPKSHGNFWSRRPGLNGRPAVYETAALPTELRRHLGETERSLDWTLSGMIAASGEHCQ